MDYIIGPIKTLYRPIAGTAGYVYSTAEQVAKSVKPGQVEVKMPPLWRLAADAGPYIRIAALSGAMAVGLGAYGAHRKYYYVHDNDLKQVYETANRYHMFHSLAMLGLPLCRKPFLSAVFFMSGILLFSGTCYYYAFTGDGTYRKYTPLGGACFIIGWLSMCI